MTIQTLRPVASAPVSEGPELMRVLIGEELRTVRMDRGLSLRDVSRLAAVSPGYISEIERGVKEPSSEFLAAITGALDVCLADVLGAVVVRLQAAEPTLTVVAA